MTSVAQTVQLKVTERSDVIFSAGVRGLWPRERQIRDPRLKKNVTGN